MSAAADQMRRARLEFTEAMARGVTIVELRRLKAQERHKAIMARIEARMPGAIDAPIGASFAQWEAPWMMRDR